MNTSTANKTGRSRPREALNRAIDICLHCGKDEAAHHSFQPVVLPAGCQCNYREWGDPTSIPPVCWEFKGNKDELCDTCEHEIECHQDKGSNDQRIKAVSKQGPALPPNE